MAKHIVNKLLGLVQNSTEKSVEKVRLPQSGRVEESFVSLFQPIWESGNEKVVKSFNQNACQNTILTRGGPEW